MSGKPSVAHLYPTNTTIAMTNKIIANPQPFSTGLSVTGFGVDSGAAGGDGGGTGAAGGGGGGNGLAKFFMSILDAGSIGCHHPPFQA